MRIECVRELPPRERFLYWVRERHQVYLRRRAGNGKPWTDDTILQSVFFTNPYREHDKTTTWFRETVRHPMRADPGVAFATACFRWFNLIATGELLLRHGLLARWDERRAVRLLSERWANGTGQVFTGAYMIKAGNGPRGCKIPSVCSAVSRVWRGRDNVVRACQGNRLEVTHARLMEFPYLGGFMAYEVVCDLRYTGLLGHAVDVDTWANPGPGALRGLLRLQGGVPGKGPDDACRLVRNPLAAMAPLLGALRGTYPDMPHFEMREVEHSLCEWDKYERALWGQGRNKRRYNGVGGAAACQ